MLDLSSPNLIESIVDQLRNMESVKAELGLWKMFPGPCLKGFGHVNRDELDCFRLPLSWRSKSGLNVSKVALGGSDHLTGERVMKEREVTE